MGHEDPEIAELVAESGRRLPPGHVAHVARLYGEVLLAHDRVLRDKTQESRTVLYSALAEYKELVPDYVQNLLKEKVDIEKLEELCR